MRDNNDYFQIQYEFPLQLSWSRGYDMPFKMGGYIQSVIVQGTVYVGGGDAGYETENNYIVMAYDTGSGKWSQLPPYRARDFAMTTIDDKLVLVGGEESKNVIKVLGVWIEDTKEWTHPYPNMLIARSRCSVAVHRDWLIVAGGWSKAWGVLSSVEIMNTENHRQNTGPLMPMPWHSMKSVVIGEEFYVMGGYSVDSNAFFDSVYYMSIPALLSQFDSQSSVSTSSHLPAGGRQVWRKISGLNAARSTPLAVGRSLLAVGGRDESQQAVSAIRLYQPDTRKWVKVGDLPTPRWKCACLLVVEREILVVGGYDNGGKLRKTDVASIQ